MDASRVATVCGLFLFTVGFCNGGAYKKINADDKVRLTSRLHDNGTVTVSCLVEELGRDVHVIELLIDGVIVASVGHYRPDPVIRADYDYWLGFRQDYMGGRAPVLRTSTWMQQLAGQVYSDTEKAFLSLQLDYTPCFEANFGCYFEGRSMPSLTGTAYLNVSVCEGPVRLTRGTLDPKDPAHFNLQCKLGYPEVTSVTRVTFMRIRRVVAGERSEFVASLSASEAGGDGLLVTSEWFASRGMRYVGHLNALQPAQAELKIDSWLCEQAGDYVCDVLYTEGSSSEVKLAMAGNTKPDVCESSITNPTPALDIVQGNSDDVIATNVDPTSFSVTCAGVLSVSSTTVGLELSLLQDRTLERKEIASFASIARLEADYEAKGFQVRGAHVNDSTPILSVSTHSGSCSDTGVYRCLMTYWDASYASLRSAVAETRKPSCCEGALVSTRTHRRAEHHHHKFSFICSSNASLVQKLLRLEISRVEPQGRTILASLDSMSTASQPLKQTKGPYGVKGRPGNSSVAYLTVISTVLKGDDPVRLVTTCKAVFVPLGGRGVTYAMTDGELLYPRSTSELR